jgi:glutamate-ammonia-ligase adenylyltransferase
LRLTQRLIAALSAPTGEGVAYPVDLRLRPSGQAGPLATHIEGFSHYQLNEAWTWEHMAMSRGRAIAGDERLAQRVEEALQVIAAKRRDRQKLAGDIAAMRARIERDKSADDPFNVKLARGGLLDCEFAAQFLVLSGCRRIAGEPTLKTLERATGEGLVSIAEGERLASSASLQAALLQIERAAGIDSRGVENAPDALRQLLVAAADAELRSAGVGGERAGIASFEELRERLAQIQDQTRAALEAVLGAKVSSGTK